MTEGPSFLIQEPDERRFWKKLAGVASRIPFAHDLLAAWYCATDPETPARVRVALMGAIAYFILPTDSIPDFIAVFGFADDASVLAVTISMVASHILPKHRDQARGKLEELAD